MVLRRDLSTKTLQLSLITYLKSRENRGQVKLSRTMAIAHKDKRQSLLVPYTFKLFDIVVGEDIGFLQVLLQVEGLSHQTLPKRA